MDELRTGLELATTDELQGMTAILFTRRFNPLDYLALSSPQRISSGDRQVWLERLERRFRFLAADGVTVLRRQSHQLSYRTVLLQVCQHLDVPYTEISSTLELEESLFLHLLDLAYQKLPSPDQQALEQYFQKNLTRLPVGQGFPAPSQPNTLRLLLKGSSALAVSHVIRPLLLRQLAGQVAAQITRYQLTQQALAGGRAVAGIVQQRAALHMVRRGVAVNLARYSAVRGFLAVLGPALWMYFFADLGWRSIATNYSRIIPVIFTIAQIRLLRGDC
ncbi:MAG: YaaW family protein [Leptolyngbyaceae cyanobacterium]